MSVRPVLKLVASESSIPRCESSDRESRSPVLSFPNDGSLALIDSYKGGLLTRTKLFRELRRLWGAEPFEGARNCYNNMKARARDGYAPITDDLADLIDFLQVLGPRPTPTHSIDRKDNEAGYSRANIRWATRREQARNRSTTGTYRLNGEVLTLQEVAARSGESPRTIRTRRSAGLSDEEAVYGRRGALSGHTHDFVAESAPDWSLSQLENALHWARSLGFDEQRVAVNELLRRIRAAEEVLEAIYVPDEYEPSPQVLARMKEWSSELLNLRSMLAATYPLAHRRFLSSATGYIEYNS